MTALLRPFSFSPSASTLKLIFNNFSSFELNVLFNKNLATFTEKPDEREGGKIASLWKVPFDPDKFYHVCARKELETEVQRKENGGLAIFLLRTLKM